MLLYQIFCIFSILIFYKISRVQSDGKVYFVDLRRKNNQAARLVPNSIRAQQSPPQKSHAPQAALPVKAQGHVDSSSKPLKLDQNIDILPTILGPVSLAPLISNTGPVTKAQDLNCDFSSNCCWANVESPIDELNWLTATSPVDQSRGQSLFQSSNVPQPPFLMIATPNTNAQTYGVLQSCAISCQSDQGVLSFNKWTSESVTLDVCILPAGSSTYSTCQTVGPGSQATVNIPPQSQPFQITITASEFINPPGGAAAIDDITYTASLCGSGPPPVVTNPPPIITNPPPVIGGNGNICQVVPCTMETLCSYAFTGCSGSEFRTTNGPTGNSNGGIPSGPGGSSDYYATASLPPGNKAILRSQTFSSDNSNTVTFKYFDTSPLAYKVCIDNDNNCPFGVVSSGVGQWRDGSFVIPPGTHTVYFIACNQGSASAYGGLDGINVNSCNSGSPYHRKSQKIKS